jgi:MFS family permease
MIIIEFPYKREKFLGLAEVASGFGLILGPVLGSLFFFAFGYHGVYVAFSVTLAICSIIVMTVLPNKLNKANLAKKTRRQHRYSFDSFMIESSRNSLAGGSHLNSLDRSGG